MAKKQIAKGKTLYRNGAAAKQPGYTDEKLKDDIALLSALNGCFSEIEGQDHACNAVKEQLFGSLHKANGSGPAATFLFAGPPAVGKTFMAQKIAEALGRPFERFDMSGYSDKESPVDLFGVNKCYEAAAPGRFTTYIKEHPVSVILLDEIEKSHITVHNNFLQILDKGEVRDLFYEQDFSVRDCILIFTTNAGTNAYDVGDPYNLSATPMPTIIKALEEERRPDTGEPCFSRELVSRFASGKIIVFNKLRLEVLHRIAVGHITEICRYYYDTYSILSKIDVDAVADLILYSQGGNADVRSIVRAVKEFFSKNFERVAETVTKNGCGGRICAIRCRMDLSSASSETADMLGGKEARVLSFGGSLEAVISKIKKSGISEVTADDGLCLHDIKRLDPDIAVVGVTNKNAAKAKALFDDLIAAGIPTYVYTKNKNIQLTYYAESGAAGCFVPKGTLSLNKWLSGAVRGIGLSRVAGQLFRANKVMTFSASYKYSKRTCAAEVILSGFAVQIAFCGGESSLFAGRSAIPDVTFDDVIGANEAKRELMPVIRQLKNYRDYQRNGIRIPRGMILDGPPGSGKTFIAKAIANAAGLPFISLNATEFLSKWVGEGEQKVRDIFAAARRYAPSIIFIDEIDCIAKDRAGSAAGASPADGLTNALLLELDGFGSGDKAPVFVIAATNFDTHGGDTLLDKALLRRFDKKIHIDLPKVCDREKYMARELSKYDFSEVGGSLIASIAKRSVGWSLAELNLVIQNAVRHSENDGGFTLTDRVLEEAFAGFSAGDRKIYSGEARQKTAYHEAGHAVAAMLFGLNPSYTTIVARGGHGGYMQYFEEDKFDLSREECLNRICVAMAGRAAEVCFYDRGGITTDAGGDIRSATDMATRMVCVYGMEEDMLCCIDQDKAAGNMAVYARVRDILAEQYGRALQLIRDNTEQVEAVAKALIERESLTDSELSALLSGRQRRISCTE